MIAAVFKGFMTGGALIVAIGAQNAYVLNQGIRKNHPLAIALVCSICDATLITVGVMGIGSITSTSPVFRIITATGGAAFLFWYGLNAFASAAQGGAIATEKTRKTSLKTAVITTLTITLLNPHVYLDTMILVGSIGGQLESNQRPFFGAGAISASFIWFFSLSIGAQFLAPFFKKKAAWCFLDTAVGITMWGIAFTLLRSAFL